MNESILGIGSNIGNKIQNIESAINAISNIPKTEIVKISKFYESEPFEVPDPQENYVNCCLRICTYLEPHVILGACLGIEACMGRERKFRFCSRIIDIDVLLYDDIILSDDSLILPHPGIKKRSFVLLPLRDLCPSMQFGKFEFKDDLKNIDTSKIKELI